MLNPRVLKTETRETQPKVGKGRAMASIVWATAATSMREANILRLLLEDPGHTAQVVDVRLFKEWSSDSALQTRRWIPAGDTAKTAQGISKFIADRGATEVRIVVSDES